MAKLTIIDVIRRLKYRGWKVEAIAQEIGCHSSTINHLINGTNKLNFSPVIEEKIRELYRSCKRPKKD